MNELTPASDSKHWRALGTADLNDYAARSDCAEKVMPDRADENARLMLTNQNFVRSYVRFPDNLFFHITHIFCPPRHRYIFPNPSRHT
jgi:hypothetical protein